MTTVIVPLDGTDVAERAVPVAVSLAHQLGADLLLVRSAWDVVEQDVLDYLDDVVIRHRIDVATATTMVTSVPADAVNDLAAQYDDAVVCLFCHGRSGAGHALLGSLGESVLAESLAPVFVVGPAATTDRFDPAGHPTAAQRRAGVCIDAATDQSVMGPFGAGWAKRLGLDVDVLTVRSEDDRPITRFHPATRGQVEALVASYETDGVAATGTVLREVQPARCLAHYAEHHHLALLIAAKRSDTGLGRDLLGSTSMNLVHQSPCPVLFPGRVPV